MPEVTIRTETPERHIAETRGHRIISDQPVDKGGTDLGMTPPELYLASLGACIGVYAGSYCRNHSLKYEGMVIRITSEIVEDPRRMGKLHARITLPEPVPEKLLPGLLATAKRCLIHNTIGLPPEVVIELEGHFGIPPD